MLIDFREKGGEREKERNMGVGCLPYMPQPGIQPETLVGALSGESNLQPFGVQDNAPTETFGQGETLLNSVRLFFIYQPC